MNPERNGIVADGRARLLEDPAPHKGGIYPLFGPVEYTYQETARVLSRVLGKDVQYKQIDFAYRRLISPNVDTRR